MPIATAVPAASGTYTQWDGFSGAASRWQAVADESDTSYVFLGGGTGDGFSDFWESFSFTGAPVGGSINSVDILSRSAGGYSGRNNVRTNGTNGTVSSPFVSGSPTDHQHTFARPGGGPWTLADVADGNLQGIIICLSPDTTQSLLCYRLRALIDYNAPAGGFLAFVMQYFGPLVAVGLHEVPRLFREIECRSAGRVRFKPNEARLMFDEIRTPRPRRLFLRWPSGPAIA